MKTSAASPGTRGRLVRCAGALLSLLIVLRRSRDLDRFTDLRPTIDRQFAEFRREAGDEGFDDTIVADASYALAASFDEVLLSATWSGREAWRRDSLARTYCNDEFVGDGFYDRLALVRRAVPPRVEVVEVFYYCLISGFQGRLIEDPARRQELVEELSREVGTKINALSPQGLPAPEGGKLAPIRRFPWPFVVAASVVIPLLVWLWAQQLLDGHGARIARVLGGS